ncbi:ABC transporter permease [Halapricum desulfuricans]|uniref:ABC-type dipeptide/oligopeptide/nickel transportsystem, permease component n=1 Tax=Halapricum desulfuricans TaxID=2841257 RepID=A0A897MYM6_9EURY|nr:ABC transporter permease [Halapricum desulfuricans]QSG05564.1 ABC-type dipeptide/oligopeptide/nickel transportsystem, permease component [Halapricum desulfuricans]
MSDIGLDTDEEFVEQSLRDRIRENPRPALVWLAGAFVLVALEFGRILDGLLAFGAAGKFLFDGLASVPSALQGNVESALAPISTDTVGTLLGALVHDAIALAMLFVVAIFLQGYLPRRLDEVLGREMGRRRRIYAERLLLTGLLAVAAVLLAYTPVGAIVNGEISAWVRVVEILSDLPTLTSREVIPNMGHRTPDGGWDGTFLGLSPAWAWAIRFALVWVYAFAAFGWTWKGFNVYRSYYREADWTPRDDTIRRFKSQYWGLFGLFVVFGFVVLAAFAPAISPVGIQEHVYEPYDNEFEYLNDDGQIETVTHGQANLYSRSNGQNTVSPMSYDDFDRWMPLGTTPTGQSMLTHLSYGARTSLVIALTAVGLGVIIAVTLSLLTAYYKGLLDVLVVITSDTIISVPVLVLVMLLAVIFQESNHWLAEPMDGGLLLALILGFAYWPGMWRSIRGPSLQVSEEEWVDAAKTYGQTPRNIMRKHMAPYVLSYIMIYASLLLGGIIITVSALSFLGLGISEPTPEWGRLISDGRQFIATDSRHVSTISGIAIALVVLGFNALGDGIRDAIDPEADVGDVSAGGGG